MKSARYSELCYNQGCNIITESGEGIGDYIYTYRTSAVVESDCFVSDSGLETGFLHHQVDSNRPQVFRPLLYYILWLAGQ